MKIKILKNRKALLEFDELYAIETHDRVALIDLIAREHGARRMAYNMWEFSNREKAEVFVFMYRLKYENKKA